MSPPQRQCPLRNAFLKTQSRGKEGYYPVFFIHFLSKLTLLEHISDKKHYNEAA